MLYFSSKVVLSGKQESGVRGVLMVCMAVLSPGCISAVCNDSLKQDHLG